VKVYQKVLKPEFEQIEAVDLRYTNGLAVRWDKSKTVNGKG
jgi:cell division septal protein FtsQ